MDKKDFLNPFHQQYHLHPQMSNFHHHSEAQMSKSSSLSHFLEEDNVSNASTIKNATRQFRDESISYDTVLREVVVVANTFKTEKVKDTRRQKKISEPIILSCKHYIMKIVLQRRLGD